MTINRVDKDGSILSITLTDEEVEQAFAEHECKLLLIEARRQLFEYLFDDKDYEPDEDDKEQFLTEYGVALDDVIDPDKKVEILTDIVGTFLQTNDEYSADADIWHDAVARALEQLQTANMEAIMALAAAKGILPFDAALMQVSPDDGITAAGVVTLFTQLEADPNEEMDPIYLSGNNAVAIGYIRSNVADKVLDFKLDADSEFGKQVIAILNDTALETPDGAYNIAGVRTKIMYA